MINNIQDFENFEDYKENLIERILEREPGIAFNPLECVNPENYIDNPLLEISLDKIDNLQGNVSAVRHGLEQFAKDGTEPDVGAFHGVRIGKQVDVPIAVRANRDKTFSIVDGNHRVVQALINRDKTIWAFVEGGKGETLKDIFDSKKRMNEANEI